MLNLVRTEPLLRQPLPAPKGPTGAARRLSRDEVASGKLRALVAYWDELRRGRRMPARGDIRPEQMRFILGQVMLIEIHRRPHATGATELAFRFHLVGTKIEATGHRGLQGRWAHELQPAFYRDTVMQAYSRAALDGAANIYRISYDYADTSLRYERATLPLSSDGEPADSLLVGTDWEPTNRRFFEVFPAIDH